MRPKSQKDIRNVPVEVFFGGDLPRFVPRSTPGGEVQYTLGRRASIKDAIEALGVPHTEIGSLTLNGQWTGFEALLRPGDRVLVLPPLPPVDVSAASVLHPVPAAGLRFLVDVNVAKLARMLRMLGFDALDDPDADDGALAARAAVEQRVVLSKDGGLLKRRSVVWARYLRADHPGEQLREVVRFFGLSRYSTPFSRCLRCNEPLVPVAKADIVHRLLPKTKRYYQDFSRCPRCDRLYWRGSHHAHMQRWLQELCEEPCFGARGRLFSGSTTFSGNSAIAAKTM